MRLPFSRSITAFRSEPTRVQWFVVAVVAINSTVIGLAASNAAFSLRALETSGLLLGCTVLTAAAWRRVSAHVVIASDMQGAWTLPVAFLLSPIYIETLLILVYLTQQLFYRGNTPVHRRIFNSAIVGLSGVSASLIVKLLLGGRTQPHDLMTSPLRTALVLLVAGATFMLMNTSLVATVVCLAVPDATLRNALWGPATLKVNALELPCAVVVTMLAVTSRPLVLAMLPVVLMLQRSLLHDQLAAAVRLDSKTGLLTLQSWQRDVEREVAKAQRHKTPLAVVLVDIDHFKNVNDAHGHLLGDQVLLMLAAYLKEGVRSYDLVGRFGGEEFVLALPGSGPGHARLLAERLRTGIGRLEILNGEHGRVRVTISVGVAMLGTDGRDVTGLLAAADAALYYAKDTGRNRTVLVRDIPWGDRRHHTAPPSSTLDLGDGDDLDGTSAPEIAEPTATTDGTRAG